MRESIHQLFDRNKDFQESDHSPTACECPVLKIRLLKTDKQANTASNHKHFVLSFKHYLLRKDDKYQSCCTVSSAIKMLPEMEAQYCPLKCKANLCC